MNTKHYTTIEQSKKLLELGLDPSTADMNYYHEGEGRHIVVPMCDKPFNDDDLPCWSLGALLEVMPRIIETSKEDLPFHFFQSESEWAFQYDYPNETDYSVIIVGSTPIEAAFNMVVYLLENGFIKKEPKTSSE